MMNNILHKERNSTGDRQCQRGGEGEDDDAEEEVSKTMMTKLEKQIPTTGKNTSITSTEMKMELRSYKDPLRELHPSTAVIRAGYRSSLSERAIKPPVFRSSAFEFATAEEGELFFQRAYNLKGNDGKSAGLVYSRLNNPNTEIFEDKMVAIEHGSKYASAFPSGMSAISTTIMALVPKGGHILFTNPVYGGTYFFFTMICPTRLDITTKAVDTSDVQALQSAIQGAPRLDAIFIETPANPTLAITDIFLAAQWARQKNPNCLVMVDNTFFGPVFQSVSTI